MSTLLYYQSDYNLFRGVIDSWKSQSIQLAYERNDLAVEIIDFPASKEFPFKGSEGELLFFLKNYSGDYSTLTIVVGVCHDSCKETLPQEFLNAVLAYPEVNFLLEEETLIKIIFADSEISGILVKELLLPFRPTPDLVNCDIIDLISTTNLYDASNLRAVARKWKHSSLSIEDNFPSRHSVREKHLALVIDEESNQSMLNGYIMYQNGYRCLPISTLRNLKNYCSSASTINYSVIIRDFDLQFPDEKEETKDISAETSAVDYIRGYKLEDSNDNSFLWIDNIHEELSKYFWKSSDYDNGRVLFLTQGLPELDLNPSFLSINKPRKSEEHLQVPGFKKPLAGIYSTISSFEPISKSFKESRYDIKKSIKRSRKGHNHSEALDLFPIAFSIVERASYYFKNRNFILASILAKDALEILNGQNITLSIQAYHLHVVSENAIVMNTIGCNEEALAQDCKLRVGIIKEDIEQLITGTEQNAQNILNQIFSDCRLCCKEKEHFASEDVFISEMAHLNYGWEPLKAILKPFNKVTDKFKKNEK